MAFVVGVLFSRFLLWGGWLFLWLCVVVGFLPRPSRQPPSDTVFFCCPFWFISLPAWFLDLVPFVCFDLTELSFLAW